MLRLLTLVTLCISAGWATPSSPTYEIRDVTKRVPAQADQTSDVLKFKWYGYHEGTASGGAKKRNGDILGSSFSIVTGSGKVIYGPVTNGIDGHPACGGISEVIAIKGACLGPEAGSKIVVGCDTNSNAVPSVCAGWSGSVDSHNLKDCNKGTDSIYEGVGVAGARGHCAVSIARPNACVEANDLDVYISNHRANYPCK